MSGKYLLPRELRQVVQFQDQRCLFVLLTTLQVANVLKAEHWMLKV